MISVILVSALLVFAGYALKHTVSCFLLSFVIAYLLDPVVVMMEKRSLRRMHGIILIYIVLSIATAFALTFMLPQITINWNNFLANLPQYLTQIKQLVLTAQDRLPPHYGSEEISWLVNNITGNADKMIEKAGATVYSFATSFFFNIFNIILSPILVFFMLHYKQKIIETSSSWIPSERKEMVLKIANEVNLSIGGYLRGQVMVSIIVAVATTAALFLLGIPHPVFSGIFAGAASILPFIGVIIATIPALFFAWIAFGSGIIIIKVLIIFSIIYFLEGYIVKPLVFKESMNLNPLLTIIMVMAFGELMGFWGILLALPLTAAIKITWQHWLKGDFSNPGNEP
jgi:putative permease